MPVLNFLIGFFEIHYYLAYLFLFLGSYFEILIGPNFFIYGEFFFLAGSILAGAGILNIWLVAFACIFGGILGDSSSFHIGKRYGHLIIRRFFKRGNKYLTPRVYKKGFNFFHKHGKKSIFLARFMGPMAWIMPFLAGTLKIKYREFLKYNIPSAILGIGEFLVIGYILGFSYARFLPKLERYVFFGAVSVFAIIVFLILWKLKVFERSWNKIFKKSR